ncbi:MAG: beta-carotene 3-hydroxylase, partial [Acidimicrobiaceae bacterium]|nr:beta-carotene 3-hydroxylase [Acidimicrobiaceae bacterium]
MNSLLTVLVAFVVMEPFTYAAHRWVMHGFGRGWHRSHHAQPGPGFESNDLFPVVFAAATIIAMAAGTTFPSVHVLL